MFWLFLLFWILGAIGVSSIIGGDFGQVGQSSPWAIFILSALWWFFIPLYGVLVLRDLILERWNT